MKERVLELLKNVRRPLSFGEIVSQMKLKGAEKRLLKKTLRGLLKDGSIVRTRKGRYGIVEEMRLVKGYFEAHDEGYGFVIPEVLGQRDIFVPPWATLGAMDGDRVIVRVENERKREGRIIRILQRVHRRVVGWLESSKGLWFVKPKRKGAKFTIYIPPKKRKGARRGDLVIAEVLTYPTNGGPATGRIVKRLKEPERPTDDIELIIDEFELSRRFPLGVTKEAKALPSAPRRRDLKGRVDLSELRTVTIDGERARDFDDAVSIRKRDFGYTLYVHIADVGYYVLWDTVVDIEARRRGTSVYLPDRVIPMLPKALSENLCSLKPNTLRLAFTVEMDFSTEGERMDAKFYPSVIVSNERMTYTDVKRILIDNDQKLRRRYKYLLEDFETMAELTEVLRERRLERGSLDFDLPEPEVLLDIMGNPEDIVAAERNFAHMIIEEFMIAANEAVAEFLYNKSIPSIYRVHAEPEPEKLEEVAKVLRTITGSSYRRLSPAELPNVLVSVRNTPLEDLINYIVLRSLKQARYSTENIGHFGLASKCYTHFTSPIRRYPDLVVHRLLREVLSGKAFSMKESKWEEFLQDIAFHSSRAERVADEVEREAVKALRAWFMKDKLGEEFDAKIVSVSPYSLRVRLKDYFVEGVIHVSYMSDDYYIFDEQHLQLKGKRTKKRYRLGDEVKVKVLRVDLLEREIIFGILD
jgi:ribonuclease R